MISLIKISGLIVFLLVISSIPVRLCEINKYTDTQHMRHNFVMEE